MNKLTYAVFLLAAGVTAGLAAQPLQAQEAAPQATAESRVVARVNGDELYQADLIAFIQRLPAQVQSQVQMLMPQIMDQLVNNKLTSQAGRDAGLATDEEVVAEVEKIEDLIIGQIYLQRQIDERVTEENIESAYQEYLKENPPQRELVARHILVETEEEAGAIIGELDAGADFAELAKEKSTGPSGAKGGELPPFQAGEMVPEFSDAAFAMEVGSHSSEPVKTQFGWHVILLEQSYMSEPPAKEEVEGQLRDQLTQKAAEEVYADLRQNAEIEVLMGQPQGAADPAENEMAPDLPESTPEGGGEADPGSN